MSYVDWHVGMQVVCTNDDFGWAATFGEHSIPVRVPMLHEVLTIAGVHDGDPYGLYLHFHEIDLQQIDGPLTGQILYAVRCFRPLLKKQVSIEVFTAMLTPSKIEEPVS